MELFATASGNAFAAVVTDPATKETAPFVRNLRSMLDTESDEILRWTPDGRAFEILDMDRMSSFVLPKYFKHRKYSSFQRQLNYFGFRKWTKSRALVCTFSNDLFVRDQPELAWRISRKKSTAQLRLKAATASVAPNTTVCAKSTPAFATKFVLISAPVFGAVEYQQHQEQQQQERRRMAGDMVSRSKLSACGVPICAATDVALYWHHSPDIVGCKSVSNNSDGGGARVANEAESVEWIDYFLR